MSVSLKTEGYQQAVFPVADPVAFGVVREAIEAAFSAMEVGAFLKSLERAKLRIRDFEIVLGRGMLGSKVQGEYTRLGNADQGQIREFYLAALEQVAPELRQKHFKLYAYY